MADSNTFTISYNGGSPTVSPSDVHLTQGQDAIVQLDGFPAGSSIDTVTVYSDQAKTQMVCQWQRSGGGTACSVYSFTAPSSTQVDIEDNSDPATEQDYWFSAAGSPSWSVDPEIENDPSGG